MTGEQLLTLLMFRLGHRTNPTIRSAAELEMQLAQALLEGEAFKPWFLFSDYTHASFVTVANVGTVTLPTGFLGIDDDAGDLYYLDPTVTSGDAYKPIKKALTRFSESYFLVDEPGVPQEWDLVNETIHLRPLPDAAYSLRLRAAWALTPIADTDVANGWSTHAPDWLLAKTLEQVCINHLGDVELAAKAVSDVQTARRRVYVMHEQRAHGGRNYEMGAD